MNGVPAFPPCDPWWHDEARAMLLESACPHAFPTRERLHRGLVMGTLWDAITREGWLEWSGDTCLLTELHGTNAGAISFVGDYTIAVFYSHEFHQSNRDPWPEPEQRFPHDLRPYLRGMPREILAVALSETFPKFAEFTFEPVPFILPNVETGESRLIAAGEQPASIMTACLWGVGETLTAAEPWPEVYEHGFWGFDRYLRDPERDIDEWREEFDVPASHAQALLQIWRSKQAAGNAGIILTADQSALFQGPHGSSARALLGALNIDIDGPL